MSVMVGAPRPPLSLCVISALLGGVLGGESREREACVSRASLSLSLFTHLRCAHLPDVGPLGP